LEVQPLGDAEAVAVREANVEDHDIRLVVPQDALQLPGGTEGGNAEAKVAQSRRDQLVTQDFVVFDERDVRLCGVLRCSLRAVSWRVLMWREYERHHSSQEELAMLHSISTTAWEAKRLHDVTQGVIREIMALCGSRLCRGWGLRQSGYRR
jgi:hypothetical protein